MNAPRHAFGDVPSVLRGVASNDNDETDDVLLPKIEFLAGRAADLRYVGATVAAEEALRALVPLCRRLGDVRIPHLYQSGNEYAEKVERVLAKEYR